MLCRLSYLFAYVAQLCLLLFSLQCSYLYYFIDSMILLLNVLYIILVISIVNFNKSLNNLIYFKIYKFIYLSVTIILKSIILSKLQN